MNQDGGSSIESLNGSRKERSSRCHSTKELISNRKLVKPIFSCRKFPYEEFPDKTYHLWGASDVLDLVIADQVARILLFFYLFYHVYLHHEEVKQMHIYGYLLVFGVPSALGIMNMIWFTKILKGLKKKWASSRLKI